MSGSCSRLTKTPNGPTCRRSSHAPPPQVGSAILPVPESQFGGVIGREASDESKPDFPQGISAPKGAPNVLLILTDDTGLARPARSVPPSRSLRLIARPRMAFATTIFTPPHCAHPRGRRSSRVAIITASALATSRSSPRGIQVTTRSFPKAQAPSGTSSSTMVTTLPGSARTI